MGRYLLFLYLSVLISGCNEPQQIYDDGAAIPRDSAVYRLSEDLKRRPHGHTAHPPYQIQAKSSKACTETEISSNPPTHADNSPNYKNNTLYLHPSLDQISDQDTDWAHSVEIQIRESLSSVPNLSMANLISVRCGRTMCEATGRIYQQIPSFSKESSYSYIEEMMFSEKLADANAIPVEVRIDSLSGEFKVIFERVRQ